MIDVFEGIKHFKAEEFDSPDEKGSGQKMNPEFIKILEKIREKAGFPFIINSAYRTSTHNAEVNGKETSAHMKGIAVDIKVNDSRQRHDLIRAAIECGISRFGIGNGFVHLDLDFSKDQRVIWLYP